MTEQLFDTLPSLPVVTKEETQEQEEQFTLWNETAVLFKGECYCVETCLDPDIDQDNIDDKCVPLLPTKSYSCCICGEIFAKEEKEEDQEDNDDQEEIDIEDPNAITLPVSLDKNSLDLEIEENDLDLVTGNEDLEALEKDPDLVNDEEDQENKEEIKTYEDLPTIEAPKKRGRKSKADKEAIAQNFLQSKPFEPKPKNLVFVPKQEEIKAEKEAFFTEVKQGEETTKKGTGRYNGLMNLLFCEVEKPYIPRKAKPDFWTPVYKKPVTVTTKAGIMAQVNAELKALTNKVK